MKKLGIVLIVLLMRILVIGVISCDIGPQPVQAQQTTLRMPQNLDAEALIFVPSMLKCPSFTMPLPRANFMISAKTSLMVSKLSFLNLRIVRKSGFKRSERYIYATFSFVALEIFREERIPSMVPGMRSFIITFG